MYILEGSWCNRADEYEFNHVLYLSCSSALCVRCIWKRQSLLHCQYIVIHYMTDFVEGWMVAETLGEGSYGEVKLLLNRSTGSAVAMKIINLIKHPTASASVRKEALVHSRLSHRNIIAYYGQRQDQNHVYIFLEYSSGGELFDRIEPDIGMAEAEAQKYFSELLDGVEYLHNMGIAHRDLKPENLLLDSHGTLKITDFGMATFFRLDGKERLLNNKCGTLPYVAPEVLEKQYLAEPADIWSCGIILVALLAGELPWDKPTADCEDYVSWKRNKAYKETTPWSKINALALSLIRRILVPAPASRYTLCKIRTHEWYLEDFISNTTPMDTVDSTEEKMELDSENTNNRIRLSFSQPGELNSSRMDAKKNNDPIQISFSQPTQIDDLLVSTQLLSSQNFSSNLNCLQKLVKRMTRFFVKCDVDNSVARLTEVVERLGYSWKSYSNGVVTINTVDRRKTLLTFKANVLPMEGGTLLDFRLSRGCGIEFKRRFMAIKREFHDLITRPAM